MIEKVVIIIYNIQSQGNNVITQYVIIIYNNRIIYTLQSQVNNANTIVTIITVTKENVNTLITKVHTILVSDKTKSETHNYEDKIS